MNYRVATIADIDGVLALHYRYQVDSIAEEEKKDGFVTTPFTAEELRQLIERERGLFIATEGDEVIAYVMAASWAFWSAWPMFAFMVEGLGELAYNGRRLGVENSCQYGPVCVDKKVRGSGVLERLFEFARAQMAPRYPVLVTFINRRNPRSFAAHTRKLGLDVIAEFDYNGNRYYELAYETAEPLPGRFDRPAGDAADGRGAARWAVACRTAVSGTVRPSASGRTATEKRGSRESSKCC